MSYITSIGIANPPHRFAQQTIANFIVNAMQLGTEDARKLRTLYRATDIDTRHSVLGDFGRAKDFDFFPENQSSEFFPSTRQRSELFKEWALKLSLESIDQCMKKTSLSNNQLTHLVVVSCTGMYAPGLDIDIVKSLKLNPSINRTCINFMGCYAAFNALKLADAFCAADKNAAVLIVCTELCSIHFQKENTEDNLLASALFADGSAALLMESAPRRGVSLEPIAFHSDLCTEGEQDMAWTIGNHGFEMKLSTYVPEVIRSGIKKLTQSLLEKIDKKLDDISFFAIHPGGKKILKAIEEELNVTRDQNRHAYEVLKKYGNMSSPTVLFVLNSIFNTLTVADDGKKILSFAFGPGLTLESTVLQIKIM